jgi:hypothetical protein
MAKSIAKILMLSCFIISLGNKPLEEKKFKLEYRVPVGTEFLLTTTRDDHYEYEFLGNPSIINTMDRITYLFEVGNISNRRMELIVKYEDVTSSTDSPQVTSPFDFSELIGEKVEAVLARNGELLKLGGFDDLPELSIPGKGLLNEEKYSNAFRVLFPRLPEHEVGIGDSWNYQLTFDEHDSGALFKVRLDYNYTLVEETQIDGRICLKISGKYTIDVNGNGEMQGMAFTAKLTGTGTDMVYFDHKKNMLIRIIGESEIKGSADVEEEDVDLSLPMHHKYKETLTVKFK